MAADSDSMRSVLGRPLLASWYKFYLSQDFNSIPASDTRPLRIPPLPPPQNGNIALPLCFERKQSFYFLFFIFPLSLSLSRSFFRFASPFFPAIGGSRLVSIGTTRRVTLHHHFRLPLFLSFFLLLFPSFDTFGWLAYKLSLLLCRD